MYACTIFFDSSMKSNILSLLQTDLIHYHYLSDNQVYVKTRKLWKFYWLNHHFKNFKRELSCYKITHNIKNEKFISFIQKKYKITFEELIWFGMKTTIHFSDINDIWLIRFCMLFI